MKSCLSFGAWLFSILVTLLITEKGRCQVPDSTSNSTSYLIIVNTRTNEHIELVRGQKLRYRLHGSGQYKRAIITDINESTVLFQGKGKKTVAIKLSELAVLKIQRSLLRRTTGTALTVIGGLAELTALIFIPTAEDTGAGNYYTATLFFGAVALPVLAGGLALKSRRKIDLDKVDLDKARWKLAVSQQFENTSMIK